jgi:hypothetical protein
MRNSMRRLCGTPALRATIREADGPELPGFALYHDAKRQFCSANGRQAGGFLIRPDGYIG